MLLLWHVWGAGSLLRLGFLCLGPSILTNTPLNFCSLPKLLPSNELFSLPPLTSTRLLTSFCLKYMSLSLLNTLKGISSVLLRTSLTFPSIISPMRLGSENTIAREISLCGQLLLLILATGEEEIPFGEVRKNKKAWLFSWNGKEKQKEKKLEQNTNNYLKLCCHIVVCLWDSPFH